MLVQSFVSLTAYMLMNMGPGFNKFDGLRSFLVDTFGIDIGQYVIVPPKGILGQVRIKVSI